MNHRLLNGHFCVEAVDLKEINIRGIKTLQAGVDRLEDGLARETSMDIVLGVAHFRLILVGLEAVVSVKDGV